MAEEVGFTLPADELKRVLIRFGGPMVLGVAIVSVAGAGSPLFGTIFVLLFCLGLYAIGKRYKYVYVSEEGIRGTTTSASRVRLQWQDGASIAQTSFNGLDGISVIPAGEKRGLYIPLAIVKSHAFREAVSRYAPAEHVIVRFCNTGS